MQIQPLNIVAKNTHLMMSAFDKKIFTQQPTE